MYSTDIGTHCLYLPALHYIKGLHIVHNCIVRPKLRFFIQVKSDLLMKTLFHIGWHFLESTAVSEQANANNTAVDKRLSNGIKIQRSRELRLTRAKWSEGGPTGKTTYNWGQFLKNSFKSFGDLKHGKKVICKLKSVSRLKTFPETGFKPLLKLQ